MRLRILVIALTIALPAAAQTTRHHVIAPSPIPDSYRSLYQQLQNNLNAAQAQIDPFQAQSMKPPLYAAELLPANGNRGTDLLQPGVMTGVTTYLDRLKQLGIRGVVFPVGYPLLLDRFPNSAQYLDFYKQVVAEAHKRGMVVDIESSVVFANSPFSSITWDYSQTTYDQFLVDRHTMAQRICSQIVPDYLDLGAEPDTEARLTGYTQLDTPAGWSNAISHIIDGLVRTSTKIGTGAGTWDTRFVELETALRIDFISMHIYPVDPVSIANAFQLAAVARAHGKAIVMDEAWLFKARSNESVTIAADTKIFQRDSYSFFVPLDQQFLNFLDDFCRVQGVSFVSPFWSSLFFSYIPYNATTATLSYPDTVLQVNTAAAANIQSGRYSTTGSYWGYLATQM